MATVAFTVRRPVPVLLALIGGAGVLVVLVLGVLILLIVRRRRAVAPLLVLALVAGALWQPGAARADIRYNGGSDRASNVVYGGCVGTISAFDPSIFTQLDHDANVRIFQYISSSQQPLPGGGPGDSLIKWDYRDTGPIPGEAAGVNYDPCAELYHELIHAQDLSRTHRMDTTTCGDSDVLRDEVIATLAENAYRKAQKLPPRTGYDGIALPGDVRECAPGKNPKRLPPGRGAEPKGTAPKSVRHCAATACATSNGDPHVETFDGQRFDFQAVGEFVAVGSPAADLIVQVRQAALDGTTAVSVNTAVAVRAGTARIRFTLVDGVIVVRRDGTAPVRRTDDGYTGDVYDVTAADGSVVSVWRTGAYGLVVQVAPAAARKGTLTGLFGDSDGDIHNDATPRDPGFDDRWRVTAATSLFDYAAGQNTATFTDRAFPRTPPPAPGGAAVQACTIAGVTEPADRADCALDVTLTGSAQFATAAADLAAQAAQVTPADPAAAAGGGDSVTIGAPGGVARHTFTGRKGQRAYVKVTATTLPAACGELTLHTPGGHTIGLGCLQSGGEIDGVLLPVDGDYRIDVDPGGDATGSATLAVTLSTDQQVSATIGGPPVTVAAGTPGAQARITFTGTAGQTVTGTATGVTVADQCGVLQIRAGNGAELAEGCVKAGAGTIEATLPRDGSYTLTLDPSHDATGQATLALS